MPLESISLCIYSSLRTGKVNILQMSGPCIFLIRSKQFGMLRICSLLRCRSSFCPNPKYKFWWILSCTPKSRPCGIISTRSNPKIDHKASEEDTYRAPLEFLISSSCWFPNSLKNSTGARLCPLQTYSKRYLIHLTDDILSSTFNCYANLLGNIGFHGTTKGLSI